jgi:competence protein ComEC
MQIDIIDVMPLYDKAFWLISFFLIGVLLGSVTQGVGRAMMIGVLLTALLALLLFIANRRTLAVLSLTIILGLGYFQWFTANHQQSFTAPIGRSEKFVGMVERVKMSGESQAVDVRLLPHQSVILSDSEESRSFGIPQDDRNINYEGLIRVTLKMYPTVAYGDVISFTGTLKSIDGPSRGYFAKEGIGATASFPKRVEIIGRGQGLRIKAVLFSIRDYVQASFERVLSPQQAVLMTGLVLGKSGGFDKEFTEKLKTTGTTHLVALSGYNIAVIINGLFFLLGFLINRRYAVWICIVAVIGFVVMTGAEASVVRAAIMATIMVIAERTSRLYSVRNAIAVTALVMILVNPNILVFDIGFRLSFMALIGIVYVKPAIEQFFKVNEEAGILEWRKNLVTTVAAQLTVLPILLSSFGLFSPLAIVTNVLLLAFIPYTMTLGFFIILAGAISQYLAFVVALPARLLLGYELGVINLFSKITFGFTIEHFPFVASLIYYGALFGFIVYVRSRTRTTPQYDF